MEGFEVIKPQSIGLLPLPYSFLLLPYIDNWKRYIEDLVRLRFEKLPEEWHFIGYVAEGNLEEATENVKIFQKGELREYNLAILQRHEEDVLKLMNFFKNELLKNMMKLLYNLNRGETFVFEVERPDFKAFVLFVNAQVTMSKGRFTEALSLLDTALKEIGHESPIFRAYMLFKKGLAIRDSKGDSYQLISLFEDILKVLKETGASWLKGEIHFQVGNMYSTFGNLTEAIKNYDAALMYVQREKDPYTWALIHNNKGLAYLSIPTQDLEDQFRLAMGVQFIKKALEVFTKDRYPEEWASATLNYANALQYLPSGNPIKNLTTAVSLYKEVVEYRKQKGNKEGYARALANMGNALAHLGKLEEAKRNLTEAKYIFIECGLLEEAQAVDEILEEIRELEVLKDGKR